MTYREHLISLSAAALFAAITFCLALHYFLGWPR